MKSLKFGGEATPDNLLTRMGRHKVTVVPPKRPAKGLLTVREMSRRFPILKEECWEVSLPPCGNLEFSPLQRDDRFQCSSEESSDSLSARFKRARRDMCVLVRNGIDSGFEPSPVDIDVGSSCDAVVDALDPVRTIPGRVGSTIHLPAHLGIDEQFQEAMAYPRIDTPMYAPLKDISTDYFLPNFNLIEQNSVTLLEANQSFIEAYMVGLNHEFARELLWREFPTDQRGSYFRQFWGVENFFGYNDLSPDARREKLYDIQRLHRWSRASSLGTHDNRDKNPNLNRKQIVLVIRGELLKRYPNTVIYAQVAQWQKKPDGTIDNLLPREIADLSLLTPAELANVSRDQVLTPLYEAKVEPDVTFLGFDLTATEAKGQSGAQPSDKPGWFFVFKERPGEPRFGLDQNVSPTINTVSDLSWEAAMPGIQDGAYLAASALGGFNLVEPPTTDEEKHKQYLEDRDIRNCPPSSARWAYLLLQAPVMIAIHAVEMLPKSSS